MNLPYGLADYSDNNDKLFCNNRFMKILFINNFFSPYGGTEAVMRNQALILRENGHEVYFFSTNKQPYLEENYEYSRFFPEYTDYQTLNRQNSLKHLSQMFYNPVARDRLNAYLDVIRPDIAHCHNIYYHLTPSVIETCKERGIPVIMTLNDPRLMCPGGTLMFKNRTYCYKQYCIFGNTTHCLLNKCRNNSLKASFLASAENLFNKITGAYNSVDLFLCPSLAMRNLAANSGINPCKLVVLNNFIGKSLSNITPEYGNKGYFLYIGRLAGEKKVDFLIRAVAQLPNIRLHIAGSGPEQGNLISLAEKLGASNISFPGYLSGEKLEEEYKNCIATILPCDWFETFGLTVIESFAYGKPVIVSRSGALPELVKSYLNGIVFQPGDIDELTLAIDRLYRNRPLVLNMGVINSQKARRLYSIDRHYKNLVRIYESLLTRKSKTNFQLR